jgi:GT2 family glycosyltransferase
MEAATGQSTDVTIVVVPRERFSTSEKALDTLYANTSIPFELVYVDAGSPPRVRRYLERKAKENGLRHLRFDEYLTPNQARNRALPLVKSKYVVFIDNDALVKPGWLEALVSCADETDAWLVGPLYFEGPPEKQIIHVAGGRYWIEEDGGKRIFKTEHYLQKKLLPDVEEELRRGPCDFVEFHCVLLRRDLFDRIGPLDEQLMSTREHLDVCIQAHEAGGDVYFEPASQVTYTGPPPVKLYDLRFFWRRWSDARNAISLNHFYDKWNLSKDASLTERWRNTGGRRHAALDPIQRLFERLFGRRGYYKFRLLTRKYEPRLNRRFFREEGGSAAIETLERLRAP